MQTRYLLSAAALLAALGASGAMAQDWGGRFSHHGGFGHGFGHGGPGMGGPGMGEMGAEMMFERADQNGDGSVTPEEFEAAAQARFTAADTNSDGQLSTDEMVAAAEARREEMRKAMEARMMQRFIDSRDTDDNGSLSFQEMTPGPVADGFFDRFDRNGDGSVTQQEFEAASKRGGPRHDRGDERRGD